MASLSLCLLPPSIQFSFPHLAKFCPAIDPKQFLYSLMAITACRGESYITYLTSEWCRSQQESVSDSINLSKTTILPPLLQTCLQVNLSLIISTWVILDCVKMINEINQCRYEFMGQLKIVWKFVKVLKCHRIAKVIHELYFLCQIEW